MPFAYGEMGQLKPSSFLSLIGEGTVAFLSFVENGSTSTSPLPQQLATEQADVTAGAVRSNKTIKNDELLPTNATEITVLALSADAMSFVYFLYALTVLLTVVGNITVIIVFARGRRSRTDIRGFLVNLAVSDLVVGIVCLPVSSVVPQLGWIFPDAMCPVVTFAQLVSVTVSIYINAAIGIDRFLAVRFPFKRLTSSRSRVAAIISAIWLSATGLASVQLFVSRTSVAADGQRKCSEDWPDPEFGKHYSVILLVFTYIAPVALVGVMYALVCRQLWSTNYPGAADALRDGRQLKAKKKVVKMLIIIVALFTVSWLPLHVFFMLLYFCGEQFSALLPDSSLLALYYFVHLLAMSNSFQNPIIYGFLNDNFRSDLSEMLILCCPFFARFEAIQKAASRQHSSVSRHCSFRRQQSERCLVPQRRASLASSAYPDSVVAVGGGGSACLNISDRGQQQQLLLPQPQQQLLPQPQQQQQQMLLLLPSLSLPRQQKQQQPSPQPQLLHSRRRRTRVSGAEFTATCGPDAAAAPTPTRFCLGPEMMGAGDDPDGRSKRDVNSNSTVALLERVMSLRPVDLYAPCSGGGGTGGAKPFRLSLYDERDVIPEECSRSEEVPETLSFINSR